jgi:AcrR family transcriptional regulator
MKKNPQPKRSRLSQGEARERILLAAERLFAINGYDAVSFRDLTAAAGVSVSAIHYHFGSKQVLLSEVFNRGAVLLTKRRSELLDAAMRYGQKPLTLESILDAFLRPAFEVTHGDRNHLFNRLRARISTEHSVTTREIVSGAFDDNDLIFIEELKKASPALSNEDVHWRFHFLVGAMIHTMSDSGQLEGLSAGTCTTSQTALALPTMIQTFAALFRAPPARHFDATRKKAGAKVAAL